MLTVAVICYFAVAIGLLLMAAKFGLGPVPASHHAAAIHQDGVTVTPKLEMVLRGVYQALAGAYLALAIVVAYLTLYPIWAGDKGIAVMVGVAGVAAGLPAALQSRKVAVAASVSTPWQVAAGLTGLVVLATVLALLA
ncbi:MAG: hypothetical protein KF723_14815 [Rhizobiaceae bacterium]|nr:hypothetical protein [Rhizobiaceae bacterium]